LRCASTMRKPSLHAVGAAIGFERLLRSGFADRAEATTSLPQCGGAHHGSQSGPAVASDASRAAEANRALVEFPNESAAVSRARGQCPVSAIARGKRRRWCHEESSRAMAQPTTAMIIHYVNLVHDFPKSSVHAIEPRSAAQNLIRANGFSCNCCHSGRKCAMPTGSSIRCSSCCRSALRQSRFPIMLTTSRFEASGEKKKCSYA